jgi:RNA polymerase sigma factor (sigma-70 family)
VHKSAHIEEITQAVQQVARGASLVQTKDVIELLHTVRREREREREAQSALAQLTPREREVLQALSEGLSDKEIAQQLHISPATAHAHVVRTLSKLGVHSRLQAVVFAASHGAIQIREPRQAARQ